MATWDSTFNASPPESQDHGRGGERIRETRAEARLRLSPEHNAGDSSLGTGYSDDGRHNPGSARAFATATRNTTLKASDGTNNAQGPGGFSGAIAASTDKGRLWLDESGTAHVLRYVTGDATLRWGAHQPFENLLMNPGFQVWQRDTAAVACTAGSNTYRADRWYVRPTGANPTVQQDVSITFAPDNRSAQTLRVNGIAALTGVVIGTRIESALARRIYRVGGDVTFSMKVKNNNGAGVSINIPTLTVSTANVVNNFAATTVLTGPTNLSSGAIADGTIGQLQATVDLLGAANDNGLQLEVSFSFSAAFAAGNFHVAEAILEYGSDRSVYLEPPFDRELARCQRYYVKTFDYAQPPVQNSGTNAGAIRTKVDANSTGGANWRFPTSMVRTPTITTYNPTAAASTWDDIGGVGTAVAAAGATGQNGTYIELTAGSNNTWFEIHASADADLV